MRIILFLPSIFGTLTRIVQWQEFSGRAYQVTSIFARQTPFGVQHGRCIHSFWPFYRGNFGSMERRQRLPTPRMSGQPVGWVSANESAHA